MWAEFASLNQHARGRLLLPARPPREFWKSYAACTKYAPSEYPKQPTFRRFKSDRPRNVIDRVARDACGQSFQNIRCVCSLWVSNHFTVLYFNVMAEAFARFPASWNMR